MDKLSELKLKKHLHLDQKFIGSIRKTFGSYQFKTDKVTKKIYEVHFIKSKNEKNLLLQINLKSEEQLLLSFIIHEDQDHKKILFEISNDTSFKFIHYCILFKYFYQYIKNSTLYDDIIFKTSRYKSFLFTRLFGFTVLGSHKNKFFLNFNLVDSLQNIWEEYYGSTIEENLYNYLLPIDLGGFVPGNVKIIMSDKIEEDHQFKFTEKKPFSSKQPTGEIKIGYDLFSVAIRDLSENGLAFIPFPVEEDQKSPNIQLNHIYSIWLKDEKLNINWTNLSIQILWEKNDYYGCKILETSPSWASFISSLQIVKNQRIIFIDKQF